MLSIIERTRPLGQSAFLLPDFDLTIPSRFSNDGESDVVLARFALACAKAGIPLPSGPFAGAAQALTDQWHAYIQSLRKDKPEILPARVNFVVHADRFEVCIGSEYRLPLIRLKRTIERLEAAHAGLGWFVWEAISSVTGHGIGLYDTTFLYYCASHNAHGCETDQEYAKSILEDEEGGCEYDVVPDDVIERLQTEYPSWPSFVEKAVEGHLILLGQKDTKFPLSRAEASALLKKGVLTDQDASCVRDALAVRTAFMADRGRDFQWDLADPYFEKYGESPDLMGAAAFIAWDDAELLQEEVSHHEEFMGQSSNVVEAHGHAYALLTQDDQPLQKLAKQTARYFKRWTLLEQLLSNFDIEV